MGQVLRRTFRTSLENHQVGARSGGGGRWFGLGFGLVVLTFQVVYLDVLLEVSKWLVHALVILPIYHNKPIQGIISKHGLALNV